MGIETVVVDSAVAVVMIRMTKVDVFELRAQDGDRPHADYRLPCRLVIIEITRKAIGSIVASDRGIADAGAGIQSGQIVRESRRRSRACANRKSCQQSS